MLLGATSTRQAMLQDPQAMEAKVPAASRQPSGPWASPMMCSCCRAKSEESVKCLQELPRCLRELPRCFREPRDAPKSRQDASESLAASHLFHAQHAGKARRSMQPCKSSTTPCSMQGKSSAACHLADLKLHHVQHASPTWNHAVIQLFTEYSMLGRHAAHGEASSPQGGMLQMTSPACCMV